MFSQIYPRGCVAREGALCEGKCGSDSVDSGLSSTIVVRLVMLSSGYMTFKSARQSLWCRD